MSASLAYREYGKGAPLVIAHGLFGSGRNWHGFAKRMSVNYRVFAVDLRNHGDSPWSDGMSLSDLGADLIAFLDEHTLSEATLLGHSLGGKAAMMAALAHPDRVSALIVVDIAPVRYAHTFDNHFRAMRELNLARLNRRSQVEAALAASITEPGTAAFLAQNVAVGPDGLFWKINLAGLEASMPNLMDFPLKDAEEYPGPALFVAGGASDYIGDKEYHRIFSLFPQAEVALIQDAGHRVHAEQPDAFADKVIDFLEGGRS